MQQNRKAKWYCMYREQKWDGFHSWGGSDELEIGTHGNARDMFQRAQIQYSFFSELSLPE